MSDQLQQVQANIVDAVQQELTRYSHEVRDEIARLREEVAAGETARASLEEQVHALAGAIEQSHSGNSGFQAELTKALEERLNEFSAATKRRHDEMNTRLGRVVDEANVGISAAVESAARPIIKQVEHRQDQVEKDLKTLDGNLRKFDSQAGQIVNHVNDVTQAIEGRLDQVSSQVVGSFDERIAGLVIRIDEVSAAAARQQAEVNNIVGTRVDQSEDRINERIVGLESRMNDEIGQRVADIDAHVGHISASLDDTVVTLSDRIAKADTKFAEVEAEFAKIREDLSNVDGEAIDEMKEQIGSALGQAELVRIEVDRFKEEIGKTVEATNVRLTELETTVQDQHLDVETAVQLERLEEVERAVLMLDPDQFVRRDELNGGGVNGANGSAPSDAVPMLNRLESPANANSPLAPPTADVPSNDTSATLQPPVGS